MLPQIDARWFQIIYLLTFYVYGVTGLGWEPHPDKFFLLIFTTNATQYIFNNFSFKGWQSASITGLGLNLLVHANQPIYYVLAAFLAIASKFIFKVKGKHLFNPGNFGLVACVFLTGQVWISPGQWGNGIGLIFLAGALGGLVVLKVKRLDTALVFILTLGILEAYRSVFYLGWGWDYYFHKMSSGSLLLFTFFMITDPMTTPDHRGARIFYALSVAFMAFQLSNYVYLYAAPIYALFLLSPMVPICDKIFKGVRFSWNYEIKTK